MNFKIMLHKKSKNSTFSQWNFHIYSFRSKPSPHFSEFYYKIFSFSSSLTRYNVVFMFLTYFIPIGCMTYTYTRVGLELWGSQSIGECTQRQLDNIKSKRKVSSELVGKFYVMAINKWYEGNFTRHFCVI